MDHRKLIAFSKGSFVVTMPKAWVDKHSLKKGDTISIEEGSNELVFYAGDKEVKKEEKSISISAENKKLSMIKSEIVSAYLNNYNTIEIFSETIEDDALVIKGILRNLSGMEIIEQTSKRIVAKDLIDVSSIPIQSIIRRMDVIARSMIDDTILCMEGKCSSKGIIHRDTDVNRLYYLGFRVIKNAMENPMLMSKFETNPWRLSSDRRILSRIEEIADRQKRISRLIEESGYDYKMLKEFKELSEDVKQKYYDAMKAYYNNDKKIAYDIEITNTGLTERCDSFLEKASEDMCLHCLKRAKSKKKGFSGETIVSASKIAEHTKATITFIKYIARTVLNMD
ncbi:MAG: phosphate uptake regulator PhoU [Candidatus Woesearchaeota archaeon]